jgi:hypothetical protein
VTRRSRPSRTLRHGRIEYMQWSIRHDDERTALPGTRQQVQGALTGNRQRGQQLICCIDCEGRSVITLTAPPVTPRRGGAYLSLGTSPPVSPAATSGIPKKDSNMNRGFSVVVALSLHSTHRPRRPVPEQYPQGLHRISGAVAVVPSTTT